MINLSRLIDKYKFKQRSLPNTKTLGRYLDAYMKLAGFYAAAYLIIFLNSYDVFLPKVPNVFVLGIPIVFCYVYQSLEREFLMKGRDTFRDMIGYIRLNQFQSLKETMAENPELVTAKFDKKSLLYWARHHKNKEANTLLIREMRKKSK